MEQKTLTNEEIARAIKVVEATTGTKIDWTIRPSYAMREDDNSEIAVKRIIDYALRREDGVTVSLWVVDTGCYHSFRNSMLMKYVKYLENYEVK